MSEPSDLERVTDDRIARLEAANARLREALARAGLDEAGADVRHDDAMAAAVVRLEGEMAAEQARRAGLEGDVDDLTRLRDALRASEDKFHSIADSVDQMIWSTLPDGYHDYYNRRWYEYTGVPEGSTDGEAWNGMFHPDDQERAWAVWRRSLETGEPYHIEYRLRHRSGEYRWVLGRAQPVRDETGAIARWYGTCTDIHDLKSAEDALRESEARFRAMADSAPSPVWVTNAEGIEFANTAFSEFSGLAHEALTGRVWMDIIHPDDLPAVIGIRDSAWENRADYGYDARFRHADGGWRWMKVSCRTRFDGAGTLIGYVGMAVDITDAKLAEMRLRESEQRYRTLFESIDEGFCIIEFLDGPHGALGDYVHVAANPAYEQHAGIADVVGRKVREMVPAEADRWVELYRDVLLTGEPIRFERELEATGRHLELAAFRVEPPERRQVAVLFQDITARKRAAAALREAEERLRIALAAGRLGDWIWDAGTDMVTFSDQAADLFGIPPGPVMTWTEMQGLIEPGDAARAAEAVGAAIEARSDYNVEYRLIQEGGGWRWINAVGRPIYGEDGLPTGMIGVVQDISARKAAEETLRAEKAALETLNRIGASLAPELDLDKVVHMVTEAGVELSGAQFGAFFYNVLDSAGESYMLYAIAGVDRSAFDKFPMPRNTQVFAPTFSGSGVVRSDDIGKDPRYGHNAPYEGMPAGHLPVTSYLAVPVVSRSGEVIGGLFFGHEEPARFTGRHEQLLVGIAGQAAVAIDNARLYEAAQREIGERRLAEEALRELNQSLEARIAAAIEERERAEEALRQAQKMEAVGQLTGGIAHDFNNLLTVITGNVDAARRHVGESGEARVLRALGNALVGAERAAVLTQRLLAFSRRQPLNPRPIDANRLVTGMGELLHRTLGETIAVETVLAAGLWRVEADPPQLENAIINLALNARDAMPDGGKVTIETANMHIDRDYAEQNAGLAPGQYVAICVSDIGVGMDSETLTRAFEPFFTTKEVGKGTGLGLSMVYGFVKQSGGHLKIYSEPGQGTTVRVYLPRLLGDEPEIEEQADARVPEGSQEETVLVCEDDDDVRAYTVEMLRELGYRVLEAHDGPSALRLLERQEGKVDLLFTDVVLPGGMTGAVVAEEARKLRPGLKILFTTGYARNAIVHHGRLDPGVELITKPFAYTDLAARVRDMLDRG